ncbi:MAG: hypothetical protein ACREBW_02735 [Candidatus Micrarchaeaceae archaeon]
MAQTSYERDLNGTSHTSTMIECPHCHHKFEWKLHCLRCGWTWTPRSDELPTVCPNPKCKSPYWNKPRIKDMAKPIQAKTAPRGRR